MSRTYRTFGYWYRRRRPRGRRRALLERVRPGAVPPPKAAGGRSSDRRKPIRVARRLASIGRSEEEIAGVLRRTFRLGAPESAYWAATWVEWYAPSEPETSATFVGGVDPARLGSPRPKGLAGQQSHGQLERAIRRFEEAGLEALPAAPPVGHPQFDGFSIGVIKGRRHARAFGLRAPAGSCRIEVLAIDSARRQVVLLVEEQGDQAPIRIELSDDMGSPALAFNERLLGRTMTGLLVERRPPGGRRRYLCGYDEHDLFVALLPTQAASVREAHEALRPPAASLAGTLRQGEWFFVPLRDFEEAHLHMFFSSGSGHIQRRANLVDAFSDTRRAGGAPHLADAMVVLPAVPALGHPRMVFARGDVRHRDHATVHLRDWRRVLRNAEPVDTGLVVRNGITWID